MATRPAGGGTDVVIVGAGHNGLVAATMLARAGRSVLVLERRDELGGAAVSAAPFPGVGVRVSRYAYLVSLFPAALARELGLDVELRRRRVASYTPYGDSGLLVDRDDAVTRESIARVTDDPGAFAVWQRFYASDRGGRPAAVRHAHRAAAFARARSERLVDDAAVWRILFEEPLSATLERTFASDLVRGVVLTDATIGTFAPADDPLLRQNRCFLYHVIGNGTGRWDVPVGGMGALSDALAAAARGAGARDPERPGGRGGVDRHRRRLRRGHVRGRGAPSGDGRARQRRSGGAFQAARTRSRWRASRGLAAEDQHAAAPAAPAARPPGRPCRCVRRHVPRQRGLRAAAACLRTGARRTRSQAFRRASSTAIR